MSSFKITELYTQITSLSFNLNQINFLMSAAHLQLHKNTVKTFGQTLSRFFVLVKQLIEDLTTFIVNNLLQNEMRCHPA